MSQVQSNEKLNEKSSCRGTPLDDIPNLLRQASALGDMEAVRDTTHTLLIKPFAEDPSHPNQMPQAIHGTCIYWDKWDEDHVRMPCSPHNLTRDGQRRWPVIKQTLEQLRSKCLKRMATIADVGRALEECHKQRFDIGCLEYLVGKIYSADERVKFLTRVLPAMISLALNVGTICSQPPPLLRANSNRMVTLSQRQAAALLSCAFFCLFPHPWDRQTYQSINFHNLLCHGREWKVEKLKCFLHYFHRVTTEMPTGVLTFHRSVLRRNSVPDWLRSQTQLCDLHVDSNTSIEDMHGLLQVDFANAFVGGGVMGDGRVQEEIRFTVCPEMLISILVSEMMHPHECIFLIGCEQYMSYEGYADTFKAKEPNTDKTRKDNWGRKLIHVVAMDAIRFDDPVEQYTMENIHRELIKAYASFRLPDLYQNMTYGIATGHWGCGAFGGDKQLKAIIQLLAASAARRPLVYLTWHDETTKDAFWTVYEHLNQNQMTVSHLYSYLQRYSKERPRLSFFDFIISTPLPTVGNGQSGTPTGSDRAQP